MNISVKNISLLLFMFLLALPSSYANSSEQYDKMWMEYETLINKGSNRDALQTAQNIYDKAFKGNQADQKFKALIHIYRNRMIIEENSASNIVKDLKTLIENSDTNDEQALLKLLLAQSYYSYYTSNQYKIIERTYSDEISSDFTMWDARQFQQEISKLYLSALSQKEELKKYPLDNYSAIIINDSKAKFRLPIQNLSDLLFHEAIKYFTSSNIQLIEASNSFEINQKAYFSPAQDFVQLDLSQKKSSNQSIALQLYQEWMSNHLQDKNEEILSYIDHKRLHFVNDYFTEESNNELFAESLQNAFQSYSFTSAKALFKSDLIQLWYDQRNDDFDYTLVQIVDEAQKVIQDYPNTLGANSMQNLLEIIQSKSLDLSLEEYIPANVPFKTSLEYKNLSTVKYKIVEWKEIYKNNTYQKNQEIWEAVQKLKVVQSGNFKLPSSGDYLSHTIEFAINGLNIGKYALITYTDDVLTNFEKGKFTISPFQVTNLAVTFKDANDQIILSVVNRKTGQPLHQIQTEVLKKVNYNQNTSSVLSAFSNVKGEVIIQKSSIGNSYYTVIVKNGQDILEIDNNYYYGNRSNPTEPNWNSSVKFFTDRSIYRQGQEVFFKGILIETKEDTARPGQQKPIEVIFRDANYQEVSKQTFTSNEYDSFSGFFRIPEGGLNGSFTINTPFGSKNIQVEDYKRPTFEVTIPPIEGNFQLGDSIHVKGQALAYSGANISLATVNYIVQRKAYFPIWGYYGRHFPRSSNREVLTTGEIQTDEEGKFEIAFVAEKDKYDNKIYEYEISVDITDITGEVRSKVTSVKVGKNSVLPSMEVDAIWTPNTSVPLKLSSNNLQNVAVNSNFQIQIETLIPHQHPKKSRLWHNPDQFSMTEAEHDRLFPYDIYNEAPTPENWKKGKVIWANSVQVFGDSSLDILPKNLPSGMYKITSIVLDKKDTIRLEKYFEVKAPLASSIQADFIKVAFDKNTYSAGDQAIASFDSDLEEAFVKIYITHGNQIISDTILHLKGNAKNFTFPVSPSTSDITSVHYEIVAQNRIWNSIENLTISTKKYDDLKFKWISFRNKLLPGAQEKWTLQILDKNNQFANAELLATMYDASLDQFMPHNFNYYIPSYSKHWNGRNYYNSSTFKLANTRDYIGNAFRKQLNYNSLQVPSLNLFGWQMYNRQERVYYSMMAKGAELDDVSLVESTDGIAPPQIANELNKAQSLNGSDEDDLNHSSEKNISLRTNFNETAFFYPFLKSNQEGMYTIDFTIPDALTSWKFLAFAHTKDLHYTILEDKVVSQKDLMIQLNAPRFVRKGDEIYLNARVSNLTDQNISATAQIIFRDASTNEDITNKILTSTQIMVLTIAEKANQKVEWLVQVPKDYEGIIYEVTVSSENHSDGESNIIPVLENRVLLTESTPIFINKKGKYEWNLKDLSHQSETSETKSITFEYTSQPVWHALMALPYLNEQNDASALSLFQKFYANTLAVFILKSIPESQKLLEAWQKEGSLTSALEKNQELKSAVLEATPWLRDAQDETEQMQSLLKLFTDAQNPILQEKLIEKLKKLQHSSGGICWFPNMPESPYITQSIVLGFYQLEHLGALEINKNPEISTWIKSAQKYLTNVINKNYADIQRRDSNYLKNQHIGYYEIQYLLTISHLKNQKLNEAEKYFFQQAQQFALNKNNYAKASLAISLNRLGDQKTPLTILNSLKQSAVYSPKEGMYWKSMNYRFWYEAPIETHAIIIQAFEEVAKDENTVNELKTWLLRQKQTHRWEQAKATADACYALLLTGGDWRSSKNCDVIKINNKKIDTDEISIGTGYIKNLWEVDAGEKIPVTIVIKKSKNEPSWGAIYYQYWEDLDKVKTSSEDLNIKRTLNKVITTETGETLESINNEENLKIGDKVRIKLEMNIQKDVEYFHLQDVRAAGFEPKNIISGYKYQGGLGYYEVNGDAATHWYFNYLPKGNFIFEYTVYVSAAGKYSSGIATGECLYAPEFRFQTEGGFLNVKN